jgi:Arc/MetJ-type ribon-helix-helix transcriptional regulator
MTIHLPDDLEGKVRDAVLHGEFASEDDMVAAILREYLERRHQHAQAKPPATPPAHKPIWERAAELRKSIPEEEWAKLPTDGARQLDHYIYGSPKRPPS